MTEACFCKPKATIKVAGMTHWQKDVLLLSHIISYFLWFCKLQHWGFFHKDSVKSGRLLSQFRSEWAVVFGCSPPQVRSLISSKCASHCAYLIGEAASYTCTYWHCIRVSSSSPFSSLSPTVPSHNPLRVALAPLFYSAMQSARMDISHATLPFWLNILHALRRALTEHPGLTLCILYMCFCSLGGNTIGRMSHRNPSYVKQESFLFWCSF